MTTPIVALDMFCGAGGTSYGLTQAAQALGRPLDLAAVNHWPLAVETHTLNNPGARHYCASIEALDPRKVCPRRVELLVASPECIHHSNARGGKPRNDQSRSSAWKVIDWTAALMPRDVLVENVPEFQSWGPLDSIGRPIKSREGEQFRAWMAAFQSMGYTVEARVLCAADYGDPTSRKRLFVRARRGRTRIQWPAETHADPEVASLLIAAGQRLPWRTAREIIEWSVPGRSIFNRKKPLAKATLRRIEEGLRRFGGASAEPFLVLLRGTSTARSIDRPLPALTAQGGHVALAQPFILGQQSGGAPRSVDEPAPTVATKGALRLVTPFLVPHYNERDGQRPRVHGLDQPVPTVPATGGGKFSLVEPFVIPYYGTGVARPLSIPLGTVTTKERFGLIEPRATLDILMRMLLPVELARATSFGDAYKFVGNQTEVVKQIGNAVPIEVAKALCLSALAA